MPAAWPVLDRALAYRDQVRRELSAGLDDPVLAPVVPMVLEHELMHHETLTYMLQDPSTIEPAIDLILISRHLERIGDHATNIAEDVIFMVSARDVRHHADENQTLR